MRGDVAVSGEVWGVLGPIRVDELGVVMMHEHLAATISEQQIVDDEVALVDEMADLMWHGCRTVVEVTNIGMGRNVQQLAHLARVSGMNIIASTGFYVEAHHPSWVEDASVDELAHRMIQELEQGIDRSGIKAGVIGEIGTSRDAITRNEAKVFRAAAWAHLHTGRPISTHTSLGQLPLEQLDLLAEEGVAPEHVTVGHLDLSEDLEVVLEVARRGAFVQLDTFGKSAYRSDEERITRLLQLVEAGFINAVLVSVDISRNQYMKAYGGYGYDHFLRDILPELRRRRLDDASIKQILEENPRRFLKGRAND